MGLLNIKSLRSFRGEQAVPSVKVSILFFFVLFFFRAVIFSSLQFDSYPKLKDGPVFCAIPCLSFNWRRTQVLREERKIWSFFLFYKMFFSQNKMTFALANWEQLIFFSQVSLRLRSTLDPGNAFIDVIGSAPGLTVNPQVSETPGSPKRKRRPGLLQTMKKIWSKKRFQVSPACLFL